MCQYCYPPCNCEPCSSLAESWGEHGMEKVKQSFAKGDNIGHGIAIGYCLKCDHARGED